MAQRLERMGQSAKDALVNATRFFRDGMSDEQVQAAAKDAGIDIHNNGNTKSDEEMYRQSGQPPVYSGSGKKMPDPAIDVKDVDQLDQDMQNSFNSLSNSLKKEVDIKKLRAQGVSDKNIEKIQRALKYIQNPPKEEEGTIEHVRGPSERGTRIFSVPETVKMVRLGRMTPQRLVADLTYKVISTTYMLKLLEENGITVKQIFDFIDDAIKNEWWEDDLPDIEATSSKLEVWKFNNKTFYIPSRDYMQNLASKYTDRMLNVKKQTSESIYETIGTHDKLVATVANYLYAKHPELFTKHGDGYVMSVVDDIVAKTEDLTDPLQDIKAFALEVMDALGADRTNEARAQVKTDWKGHHLVNADGAVVQTYPKDADNLEVARERLYKDYRRLNTMTKKNEDLNEAFENALKTLSESVTINTTTSSEGEDTVNVSATGKDAYELVNILKAAGIPHDKAQQYAPAPCDAAIAMPVEEEYANEPEEDVMNGDMDHMNTQSGGLNRRKMQQQYANPLGDNPLAESEDLLRGLWDLYKEAK